MGKFGEEITCGSGRVVQRARREASVARAPRAATPSQEAEPAAPAESVETGGEQSQAN